MKKIGFWIKAVLVVGMSTGTLTRVVGAPAPPFPLEAAAAAAPAPKAKPYPLEFCLVTDEKFAGSDMKPFEMVHEGQIIKFCCKSCVKDFKKDTKKYLKKFDDEVKKKAAAKK